jgi:hypothetical protein
MSKLSEKFNNTLKLEADSRTFLDSKNEQIPNIGSLYIHDSNQLPSFPKSKLSSLQIDGLKMQSIVIFYEKKSFKLLPAPYQTNCYHYSGSIKSQAQCLNELLIKEYLQNNCFPKNDDSLTFVINNKNYSEFDYRFCENNTFKVRKNPILNLNKCRKACNEELYESWYSEQSDGITLKSIDQKYICFEHKPGMEFNQYLVNFGGLLGLWHGLSLLDLKISIIKITNKIFSLKYKMRNYRKYFPIFKFGEKIRTYLRLKVYN